MINDTDYDAEKKSLITRQYVVGIAGLASFAAAAVGILSFIPKHVLTDGKAVGKILTMNPVLGGILAVGGGVASVFCGIKAHNIDFDLEEFNRKRNAVHLANTLEETKEKGISVSPAVVSAVAQQQNDEWAKRMEAEKQARNASASASVS